jgi:hypothetical protein
MTFMPDNPRYYEQQYETLRGEALSAHRGLERGHGLALFLSQGMLAWMQALATLQPPRPASSVGTTAGPWPSHPKLSRSFRGELTTVLAGMVLACHRSPTHE